MPAPVAHYRMHLLQIPSSRCAMHRYYQLTSAHETYGTTKGPVLSLQNLTLLTIAKQPYPEVVEAVKDLPEILQTLALSGHVEGNRGNGGFFAGSSIRLPPNMRTRLALTWAQKYANALRRQCPEETNIAAATKVYAFALNWAPRPSSLSPGQLICAIDLRNLALAAAERHSRGSNSEKKLLEDLREELALHLKTFWRGVLESRQWARAARLNLPKNSGHSTWNDFIRKGRDTGPESVAEAFLRGPWLTDVCDFDVLKLSLGRWLDYNAPKELYIIDHELLDGVVEELYDWATHVPHNTQLHMLLLKLRERLLVFNDEGFGELGLDYRKKLLLRQMDFSTINELTPTRLQSLRACRNSPQSYCEATALRRLNDLHLATLRFRKSIGMHQGIERANLEAEEQG